MSKHNTLESKMAEQLRALRTQEIEHTPVREMRPYVRPLPPINSIGKEGVHHLNVSRTHTERSEISRALSFSQRLPFTMEVLPGHEILSLGGFYVFLATGARHLEALGLDSNDKFRNFNNSKRIKGDLPNMYAFLAQAVWAKFSGNELLKELMVQTGEARMGFDFYTISPEGEKRRFFDSDIICAIYEAVRNALKAGAVSFNSEKFLDEPDRIAVQGLPREEREGYITHITQKAFADAIRFWNEKQAAKVMERKPQQHQTQRGPRGKAGALIQGGPAAAVNRPHAPAGMTYQDLVGKKPAAGASVPVAPAALVQIPATPHFDVTHALVQEFESVSEQEQVAQFTPPQTPETLEDTLQELAPQHIAQAKSDVKITSLSDLAMLVGKSEPAESGEDTQNDSVS